MTYQDLSHLKVPPRCSGNCEPGRCDEGFGFGPMSLDRLMPMHLVVGLDGTILRVAPTLQKLRPGQILNGASFWELFELRRPRRLASVSEMLATEDGRLALMFRTGIRTSFKAIIVPLPCDNGALINLSFGISVVEAVRAYDLTVRDFSGTDLAVEMLYLVEAKSAALHESKKLNLRLEGAKVAAEEQAFTDTLTGLKNRRAMDHVVGRLLGEQAPFALMQIDLDFFKQVNDTYGHAAGDEVLQAVARVLVAETRQTDMVARVGGDEFVLVFMGVADLANLELLAKRIISRLEEPIPFGEADLKVSGSIGLTSTEIRPGATMEELLQDADMALYSSKHAGRSCCTIAEPPPA